MSGGYLRHIVEATRAAVSAPSYLAGIPSRTLRPAPSLRKALPPTGARRAVLAEYKRRSPGALEPELPERTPEAFVRALEPAPISGYSCLGAIPDFRGGPADVREVVRATRRPVLFKDFVVDPVQLEAAARAGASAVLLIARLETMGLLDRPLSDLARRAHALGLEVVLEWHERAELRRTEDVPADVYGVNVRDLDSLRFRRDVAAETIRAATSHRPLVGLSGVAGPEEASAMWDLGVDAILVGTALARAPDPVRFVRSLQAPGAGGPS